MPILRIASGFRAYGGVVLYCFLAISSGLRSEANLVDLGLNEITDPATKTFRRGRDNTDRSWFTPQVLSEIHSSDITGESLIFTNKGFVGRDFSGGVRNGDLICVLLGCPAPVALCRSGTHYEFIRSVYVDGIMFGEAMDALERGEVELEDFELH